MSKDLKRVINRETNKPIDVHSMVYRTYQQTVIRELSEVLDHLENYPDRMKAAKAVIATFFHRWTHSTMTKRVELKALNSVSEAESLHKRQHASSSPVRLLEALDTPEFHYLTPDVYYHQYVCKTIKDLCQDVEASPHLQVQDLLIHCMMFAAVLAHHECAFSVEDQSIRKRPAASFKNQFLTMLLSLFDEDEDDNFKINMKYIYRMPKFSLLTQHTENDNERLRAFGFSSAPVQSTIPIGQGLVALLRLQSMST